MGSVNPLFQPLTSKIHFVRLFIQSQENVIGDWEKPTVLYLDLSYHALLYHNQSQYWRYIYIQPMDMTGTKLIYISHSRHICAHIFIDPWHLLPVAKCPAPGPLSIWVREVGLVCAKLINSLSRGHSISYLLPPLILHFF